MMRGIDADVRPLHAGGGERLFGRGERPRAELFRKRLRALCRAVPNRGNAATALLLDLYGDLAGDVARADERPAELCQLRFLLFNFLFIFFPAFSPVYRPFMPGIVLASARSATACTLQAGIFSKKEAMTANASSKCSRSFKNSCREPSMRYCSALAIPCFL